MAEMKNAYRIFVGNTEGKWLRRRPRRRCEDNIKMDIREIGWEGGDWIRVTQDRVRWQVLVNTIMKLREP